MSVYIYNLKKKARALLQDALQEIVNMVCLPLFQAMCALLSLMAKKMTTTSRPNIRHVTRKTSNDELPPVPVRIFVSLKLPENVHNASYFSKTRISFKDCYLTIIFIAGQLNFNKPLFTV